MLGFVACCFTIRCQKDFKCFPVSVFHFQGAAHTGKCAQITSVRIYQYVFARIDAKDAAIVPLVLQWVLAEAGVCVYVRVCVCDANALTLRASELTR